MWFPDPRARARHASIRAHAVLRRLAAVLVHLAGRGRRALPALAIAVAVLVPAIGAGAVLAGAGGSAAPVVAAATGPTGPVGIAPVPAPAAAPAASTGPTGAAAVSSTAGRAGAGYYRQTTTKVVPASTEVSFLPLYKEAGRAYGVAWQLVASIHRQETAFSTEPSTYRGRNAYGCCAGPMQFNLTNGPVSTWTRYKQAFRQGVRPASYPHPTLFHPSIYDDFDAIMAAAALLRDGGAGSRLDGGAWLAAYGYYGHDEFGVTYADQVVGRAQGWARKGFCVNCADDPGLLQALEDAYGVHEREVLGAAAPEDPRARRERQARRRAVRARRARTERDRREAAAAGKPSPKRAPAERPGTSSPRPKPQPTKPVRPLDPVAPSGTTAPSGPTATGTAACVADGCPG